MTTRTPVEAKHTPGKSNLWLVGTVDAAGSCGWGVQHDFPATSDYRTSTGAPVTIATAIPVELAAAAEDLLAACEIQKRTLDRCARFFLGLGGQPTPEEIADATTAARAAIAKAGGA